MEQAVARRRVARAGRRNFMPKDNLELVQDAYKQLLAYIRFLLQTQSIGGVLPGETNRLA